MGGFVLGTLVKVGLKRIQKMCAQHTPGIGNPHGSVWNLTRNVQDYAPLKNTRGHWWVPWQRGPEINHSLHDCGFFKQARLQAPQLA